MKPGTSDEKAISSVNAAVAECFDEIADLLQKRCSTDFRISTYRRGAGAMRELLSPVDAIYEDSGREGLEDIPGLGQSLALSIEKFLMTGLMPTLELLRGNGLSSRLMRSAGNPRPRRVIHARHPVNIDRPVALPVSPGNQDEPSIEELLSIDAEYRKKAAAGELDRIAPRQFNPAGDKWLPVLHTRRNRWHYTAAFSNTAHAHEEGMTQDWVIIHRDASGRTGHWTVITSMFGNLQGRRIVRGREGECLAFYHRHPHAVVAEETFEPPVREQQKLLFEDD